MTALYLIYQQVKRIMEGFAMFGKPGQKTMALLPDIQFFKPTILLGVIIRVLFLNLAVRN